MVGINVTLDQSILLELAMSYCFSEGAKNNANNFLSTLSKYFQLDFAGCWHKEKFSSTQCTPIYVYPKHTKCGVIQNPSLIETLQQKEFIISTENQPHGKDLLDLIREKQGNVLIFNTPFLFIYLFRKTSSFSNEEGEFLKKQILKFSGFLKYKFENNILTERVRAYEIKEESFLKTQKVFQKEQQSVKDELIKTQARLMIMYKNMGDGIFLYNYITEKIIDFNEAAFKAFGYEKREDLLKMNRFDFIPQFSNFFPNVDLHEYTKGHGFKVRNGESIEKTIGVFVGKGNRDFLVEANVVPTHQEKGEAFIIFRDTTERILAQKKIKSREKRYRQIFEHSHEAIIYFDVKEQKIVDCNNQALKLFEANNKERFLNSNFEDFYFEQDKEINAFDFFKEQVDTSIEKGKANFKFLAKTFRKNTFWADGNIIVEMESNRPRKFVIFIRDITEEYNNRKELQLQHEKLKRYIESNMQLENFAYVASHDLQTPLRTIISFTQLLSRSLERKVNDAEQEYMDFIIKATKNMQNLIQDLLNYSHVNNAQNRLKKVEVVGLLSEIKEELQFDIQKNNATINFPMLPFLIYADNYKLKQLFQNLLTNAIKFKKPNQDPIININFESKEKYWHFTVKDNGIGIDTQYQEKIFLLFKRLHGKNQYEGTGIGLAMCKKIVEQHQGEIWFESTMGEGTTFHFSIRKK